MHHMGAMQWLCRELGGAAGAEAIEEEMAQAGHHADGAGTASSAAAQQQHGSHGARVTIRVEGPGHDVAEVERFGRLLSLGTIVNSSWPTRDLW